MESGKENLVANDMELYRGEILTISGYSDYGEYEVKENNWYWTDEMFEGKVWFNAGDAVKFDNEEKHREYPEWYPKVGTLGTVLRCDKDCSLLVQWESGSTSAKNYFFCNYKDVVKINPNTEKGKVMSKFKVGDRVEVIKPYCSAQVGDVGVIKALLDKYYAVEFDRESKVFHDCLGHTRNLHGYLLPTRHLKLLDDKEKIVITHDGKTVTAKLTKNGETVKTANARCHPDDEFDFGIGAKLAVKRLFAHEPEYFTGDVVCVEDPKEFYFTVGKIYHVENGSMSTGHYIISKLTSIDDLNARFNNVRFIELVK